MQKAFANITNQQGVPGVLLAIGTCALVCYITQATIGWKITNHSLEKLKYYPFAHVSATCRLFCLIPDN